MNRHLTSGDDLAALARERGLDTAAQEQLWVAALDNANNLRSFEIVGMGGFGEMAVSIPAILRAVIVAGADRFCLVHNHPGGSLDPSEPDKETDAAIIAAAQHVHLLHTGHMIVAGEAWQWM
jgi:DNA repair protein RadC